MDSKNYYMLLELSIDPPEEDPAVIEEAIKKMQAKWSRLRNHPTKGTLAQQYVGMIPDIRKVMGDPKLRRQEARKAQKILSERRREQYAHVDRHLRLLFSKGDITDAEIQRVAEYHGFSVEKIRKRAKQGRLIFRLTKELEELIEKGKLNEKQLARLAKRYQIDINKLRELVNRKKNEKFEEIDRYLAHCLGQGYVVQSELDLLSQLYNIDAAQILRRVRCPIRQEGSKKAEKPLDGSIEKIINDNLKIVGKKSLYDFLGLAPSAKLEALQEGARQKEAEVRQLGQKDAVATASGVLAGQCLTLFKTEQSRSAYNLSLIRAELAEINSDIEVAQENGVISAHYFTALLRSAIRVGMDPSQAREYILEYARSKGWEVALPKLKKPKKPMRPAMKWSMVAGAAVLVLVLAAWTVQGFWKKMEFDNAMAAAQNEPRLENKVAILRAYIQDHSSAGEYTQKARKAYHQFQNQIQARDYQKSHQAAQAKVEAGEYRAAMEEYERFRKKHPDSIQVRKAKEAVKQIRERIDDRDFKALAELAGADLETRMNAYDAYLENHPHGNHVKQVKKLIHSMVEGYYEKLKTRLSQCEAAENWEKCVALSDEFIKRFQDTPQAETVQNQRLHYIKRQKSQADLADLKGRAEELGEDYESAITLYQEYLAANPEAPGYLKQKVLDRISDLEAQIEERERQKAEWAEVQAYVQNQSNDLKKRLERIKGYLAQYPGGNKYTDTAKDIRDQLQSQWDNLSQQRAEQAAKQRWRDLLRFCKSSQNSLDAKISEVQTYVANKENLYLDKAQRLLAQLQAKKQQWLQQQQQSQAEQARIQRETQRMQGLIRQSSRFRDNGNGTVTDSKTGKTWTLLDSTAHTGRCMNYEAAQQYAQNLNTGGYQDWRLPSSQELVQIYKSSPYFPTLREQWYWSSDLFWHGWNQRAQVVTSQPEEGGARQPMELNKCGAVRAVRP